MTTLAGTSVGYHEALESAVTEIERIMSGHYSLSRRAMALLLLQDDEEIEA